MNKSNLILILKNLDAKEFKEFGELVHSPFFNKNQGAITLYDYLKKYYPEFKADAIEKEHVYTKIFHKAEYNDGFMRTVIFNLASLAEEYLLQTGIRNNQSQRSLMLLEELNRRKLEKAFSKNLPQAEKDIEEISGISLEYNYCKYLYNNLLLGFTNWSRFKTKNLKDYDYEISARANKYLLNYYLIKVLANYRLFLLRKESINIEFDSGFIDELIKYITSHEKEFDDAPLVILHVNEILLIRTKSDEYYYRLKNMLAEGKGMNVNHRYSLLNLLQGFWVHKKFSGFEGANRERFELYKMALERKFHRATGDIYFDDLLFPSIARSAINLGEFDWAEKFISDYEGELAPENKEVISGYLNGRLMFAKGKFEDGIKAISKIKSTRHNQYKVIIRCLSLMLYYELSYFDQADYQMASFRQYINKNRKLFSDQRYVRLADFLKYFSILMKLKAKAAPDDMQLDGAMLELDKNTNILEREWLVEKAKELERTLSGLTK